MTHSLKRQFKDEIVEASTEFEELNLTEADITVLLDEGVEIDDPSHYVKLITGQSLHNAKRKEPITVRVNLRDLLSGWASLLGGAMISNPYVSGFVMMLIVTSIVLRNTEQITPYQALTYGIGWEMAGDKHTFVNKGDIIDEVVTMSRTIDAVENLDRVSVENALQELARMNCIDMEEVEDEVLVWFREEFEVKFR